MNPSSTQLSRRYWKAGRGLTYPASPRMLLRTRYVRRSPLRLHQAHIRQLSENRLLDSQMACRYAVCHYIHIWHNWGSKGKEESVKLIVCPR